MALDEEVSLDNGTFSSLPLSSFGFLGNMSIKYAFGLIKYSIVDCIESPILRIRKQFTQLLTMFLISEKMVHKPIAIENTCPKNANPLIRESLSLVHGNVGKTLSIFIFPSITSWFFLFSSSFPMRLTIVGNIASVSPENTK